MECFGLLKKLMHLFDLFLQSEKSFLLIFVCVKTTVEKTIVDSCRIFLYIVNATDNCRYICDTAHVFIRPPLDVVYGIAIVSVGATILYRTPKY